MSHFIKEIKVKSVEYTFDITPNGDKIKIWDKKGNMIIARWRGYWHG